MQIVDRGIVFSGEKETRTQSAAFPQICVLPSGRWLCTFRAAPEKSATIGQCPLILWSDDEGKSWSKPIAPFSAPSIQGKPGVFRGGALTAMGGDKLLATILWVDHSDPSVPYFNEETEGLLDSRIFFSTSPNAGNDWSAPELMDTSPYNVPTPITGPILILPNGDMACQFELNKHYYDTEVWHHSSVMMFSNDRGKTWPEHVLTSCDPENRIFYWDQRPSVLLDGRILDVFWTYDNKDAVYLNIHARSSLDNGRSWSKMWDTGVPGQPAPPVSLSNEKIALIYVERTTSPAIKVRTSSDQGKTWPKNTEFVIHETDGPSQTCNKGKMQDAWTEMRAFSLGLPATARLGDGDILVVYYSGPHTDKTAIHWARIKT